MLNGLLTILLAYFESVSQKITEINEISTSLFSQNNCPQD